MWGFLSALLVVFVPISLIAVRLLRFSKSTPSTPATLVPVKQSGLVSPTPKESCLWLNAVGSYLLSEIDLRALAEQGIEQAKKLDWLANPTVLDVGWGPHPPRFFDRIIAWTSQQTVSNNFQPNSLHLLLDVDLDTTATITVSGDFVVNWPGPAACALPLRIKLSNIKVLGPLDATICLQRNFASVSFAHTPEIQFDLVVEFGVGYDIRDEKKLRNLVKQFLQDAINDKMVSPNLVALTLPPFLPQQ